MSISDPWIEAGRPRSDDAPWPSVDDL